MNEIRAIRVFLDSLNRNWWTEDNRRLWSFKESRLRHPKVPVIVKDIERIVFGDLFFPRPYNSGLMIKSKSHEKISHPVLKRLIYLHLQDLGEKVLVQEDNETLESYSRFDNPIMM